MCDITERTTMYPSKGLETALNAMREMSVKNGSIYHQYVPVVTESTTIGEFGAPILDSQNLNVLNDFIGLLKKVVYTAVYNKTFNNPLAQLEGERMPLGQFIEDVYINPQKARGFDVKKGVEGLNAVWAAVVPQVSCHLGAKRGVEILPLQFDQQGHATVHQPENLTKRGDGLLRAVKMQLPQIGGRQLGKPAFIPRHTCEGIVVKNHDLAVTRKADVQLYAISRLTGKFKGMQRIFRHPIPMQPAVGIITQQGRVGRHFCTRTDQKEHIQ